MRRNPGADLETQSDLGPPPFSKLAPTTPKTPRNGTRLAARSGVIKEEEEDEEESEEEDLWTGRKTSKAKKESLKDLLDSDP